MKKIKFIMPVFATATIATTVAPLASCGQEVPKMTMLFEEDLDWGESIYTYKSTPIYYYFKIDKKDALPKLQVKLTNLKIGGIAAGEYKPGVTDNEIQTIVSFKATSTGKIGYIKLQFNLQKYWAIFGKSNDTAKFSLVFSNEENGYKFSQSFDNFVLPFRYEAAPEEEPTEAETITLKKLDEYTPEEKAKLALVFDYSWDIDTQHGTTSGIRLLLSDYLRTDPGAVLEDNGYRKIVINAAADQNEGYVKYLLGGTRYNSDLIADPSAMPTVATDSFPKGIKLVLDDADQPLGSNSLQNDGGILFNVAFPNNTGDYGFEEIDLGKKFSSTNAEPTPLVLWDVNGGFAPFSCNTNLKKITFSNRVTLTARPGEGAHLFTPPFQGCKNIECIDVAAWKTAGRVQSVIDNEWIFGDISMEGARATMFSKYSSAGGSMERTVKNFADRGTIIVAKGADQQLKDIVKNLFLTKGGFEASDFDSGNWQIIEDTEE